MYYSHNLKVIMLVYVTDNVLKMKNEKKLDTVFQTHVTGSDPCIWVRWSSLVQSARKAESLTPTWLPRAFLL